MSVSGGDYRGFVLRPVIKAVEKKHRRIEFHRFTLGVRQPVSAQNIRNIPERSARKILLIHCPHLAVAVLLKGEQPAKGRGKFLISRDFYKNGKVWIMAEANDLTVGRVISQERKFKEISKINKHSR